MYIIYKAAVILITQSITVTIKKLAL